MTYLAVMKVLVPGGSSATGRLEKLAPKDFVSFLDLTLSTKWDSFPSEFPGGDSKFSEPMFVPFASAGRS